MAKHPGWLVAKEFATRLETLENVSAVSATLNFTRLAKIARRAELFYISISPEQLTRSIANRRVRIGSVQFTITVRVAKHTGQENVNDNAAEEAFYDKVQEISDRVLGLSPASPEGTDIVLPSPWGTVNWPSESLEEPTDEDLGTLSIRNRTIQFQFAVTRQGA